MHSGCCTCCKSFIFDSSDVERTRRMQFFGKRSHGRRSRAILEGFSVTARACGGAYPVNCWGVVQSVGHLTVNEDGGGSNPPAPANLLKISSLTSNPEQSANQLQSSLASHHPLIPRWYNPFFADCPQQAQSGSRHRSKGQAWSPYQEFSARYHALSHPYPCARRQADALWSIRGLRARPPEASSRPHRSAS